MITMNKIAISKVIITTHCHATEDLEKVKQAMLNILNPDLRNKINIEQETLYGYHRNPITRLKIVLEENDALEFLKYLMKSMSEGDKQLIVTSIEMRYNKKANEIFIRLNKQDAYLGIISVYDGDDAIKISISFSMLRSVEAIRNFLENLVREGQSNV